MKKYKITGDYVLVWLIVVHTDGLNLEAAGLTTERGKIEVDEHTLQTKSAVEFMPSAM